MYRGGETRVVKTPLKKIKIFITKKGILNYFITELKHSTTQTQNQSTVGGDSHYTSALDKHDS